jgi:hypothetical protein
MRDKNDVEIYEDDRVIVDDPGPSDDWNHSFSGTVDSLDREEWWVIVEDGDGEIFWVDPGMIEVVDLEEPE